MSLSCAQCGLIGSVVDTACRRCGATLTNEQPQQQQLTPYNPQQPAPWQSPQAQAPQQNLQPWQQQSPQQAQTPQQQWPGQQPGGQRGGQQNWPQSGQPQQQYPQYSQQPYQQQYPQQQQQQQYPPQQQYPQQQYPQQQQPYPPPWPGQPVVVVNNSNNNNMPMPYREIKNPGLAAILSFFIPGLGQLYNGEIGKGILMFFGTLFLLFFFVGIGVYVWSIIDAYHTAKKINSGLA